MALQTSSTAPSLNTKGKGKGKAKITGKRCS